MTWVERTGLTQNQLYTLILMPMLILASVAGVNIAPLIGLGEQALTEDKVYQIAENVTVSYNDLGLGGSPYKTMKQCSYIIGNINVSGTVYYYAFDGDGSSMDYSGTNASTVTQAVIDALTTGGSIFIRNGYYDLGSQGLDITTSNIELIGETKANTWSTSPNGVLFRYSGTENAIEVGGDTNIYNIRIEGIGFFARSTADGASTGLYMENSKRGVYTDLGFEAFGNATHLFNGSHANTFSHIYTRLIRNNSAVFEMGSLRPNGNLFDDWYIEPCPVGFYIENGQGNIIRDCLFQYGAASTSYGIHLKDNYNFIINPQPFDWPASPTFIKLDGAGVENNYIHLTWSSRTIEADDWDNNMWSTPYTSANGQATVASQEWINHTLSASPKMILVTPRTFVYDGVPIVVSVGNRNSTMFQIRVYWVNGTEITDDTILIDWKAKLGVN
jgi:hypothetical protein